jgi:hypothetical protein
MPDNELVAVTTLNLRNLERFIEMAVVSLYRHFLGADHDSDMWWHGDLETVSRSLDGYDIALYTSGDLLALLESACMTFEARSSRYRRSCGVLTFWSPIEPEHGIGFLTDGVGILGIGYGSEKVLPFLGESVAAGNFLRLEQIASLAGVTDIPPVLARTNILATRASLFPLHHP